MRLIKNTGSDRVIDELKRALKEGTSLDIASTGISLFAFHELSEQLTRTSDSRLLLSNVEGVNAAFLGMMSDRQYRNRLQSRWLAYKLAQWIRDHAEVRSATASLGQSAFIAKNQANENILTVVGNCSFTTSGFGITPSQQLGFIQCADSAEEMALFSTWFESLWNSVEDSRASKTALLNSLSNISSHKPSSSIYAQILAQIFTMRGDQLDEDRVIKSATGIKNTTVWKKLFRFQRDGVVGALDKLDRFGGCIIADSVGLGKTFEALAIIKYYELRNDRVLVLAPKRLRDNWTLYKANDRRNILSADRFNYDVLNHTDLSRDGGLSGDIDLAHVNWGNYDLVVIDESHNFRNKTTYRDREARYDRLMQRIIKEGVKTRVLMLSATPVNNRLADLRNQIAFVTEGSDTALYDHGIASIENTTRLAQQQFNRWLTKEESERTPGELVDMLGFDYFQLLDLLTIARSRKHIVKYYGTSETGTFPVRLKPINIKPSVDQTGEFPSIHEINNEIRRLHLASYAPLRYVLPHKQKSYDTRYGMEVRGGESFFRQVDREENMVHLLRVNMLKRMESAVSSFALTVQRQIHDVESTLEKIEARSEDVDEHDISDIDIDDPSLETLMVGRKVKVLLQDVDLIRWKQDLLEDRNRLANLHAAAKQVSATRDAKLHALRELIESKCRNPINPDNKKVIVFTAFSDTAHYLYDHLAGWAQKHLQVHCALVTGTGTNKTTLPNLRKDLGSVLSAFSPFAKERPDELRVEGDLDLLIATDCISEGQNLQDCDWLINYDIHWNPVRIIQRFGRIDRIGSPNKRIQLVNFWPNMEIEEYINLEQRVSGRMVLLDVSATGEENLIELQSGNQMNDLEYRRKQLLKLQDAVIDMEDLSSGISITDLTLTDYRIDLSDFMKEQKGKLEQLPFGACAVVREQSNSTLAVPPGVIFCLRAEGGHRRNTRRVRLPAGTVLSCSRRRRWFSSASVHTSETNLGAAETPVHWP
jgi:SNF2 family DNA or RNA helicase